VGKINYAATILLPADLDMLKFVLINERVLMTQVLNPYGL
jgi:hypothetical protein